MRALTALASLAIALVLQGPASAMNTLWQTDLTDPTLSGASTLGWRINDDSVYSVSERALVRANLGTGAPLWVREIGGNGALTPFTSGGIGVMSQYWPDRDAVIQRFSSQGSKLWEARIPITANTYVSVLRTHTPSEAMALHLGDTAGTVVVFDSSGVQRWRRATGFAYGECVLGSTGAVMCASRARLGLFARLDGTTLLQASSDGFFSNYERDLASNVDGSFSVAIRAYGSPVRRWSATGALLAEVAAPAAQSQWQLRTDGGSFAIRRLSDAYTSEIEVVALSAAGAFEWRVQTGVTGDIVEARALGDALYVRTYWNDLHRFRGGELRTTQYDPPISLATTEVVNDDFIFGPSGPLQRRNMVTNTVVWSQPDGWGFGDNAYQVGCSPLEFRVGDSLYATHGLGYGRSPKFDIFVVSNGNSVERIVADVPDVDDTSPTGSMSTGQHCRITFDETGVAERVVARKFASGAISWRLRRTDAAGNTVSESADVPLPAGSTWIRTRDIERAPDGTRFVVVNHTVSKLDAGGNLLWSISLPEDTNTQVPVMILPDGAGGAFVYASSSFSRYLRSYASDGTLRWQREPASALRTWTTNGAGNLVVAYVTFGDTVESISSSGQSRWTNTLILPNGSTANPEFRFLARGSNGDIVVAGCYSESAREYAFVMGFSSSGARTFLTLLPKSTLGFDSCPSSLVVRSTGDTLVSIMQDYWASDGGNAEPAWNTATYLISPAGVVEAAWHDLGDKKRRTLTGWTHTSELADGSILQAGRFASPPTHFISTSARRWNVPAQRIGMTVELPSASYQYGEILPLRFTLVGPSNSPIVADTPRPIWVVPEYIESDDFSNDFPVAVQACVVGTGESSCVNSALRIRKVGTGLAVQVFSDGVVPARSPVFEGKRADVVLSARVLTAPPYVAYQNVTVEYTLTPGYLAPGETMPFPELMFYYDLPSVSVTRSPSSTVYDCAQYDPALQFPMTFRCNTQLGTATVTQSAVATMRRIINESNRVDLSLGPVSPGAVAIKLVRLWPNPDTPVGAPMSPVVSVTVNNATYTTQLPAGSITLRFDGQTCAATPIVTNYIFGQLFYGEYTCAITPNRAAVSALVADFSGGNGLSPVAATTLATINAVPLVGFYVDHVLANSYAPGASICSTTPGLNCQASPQGTSSLCTAAPGWTGLLYVKPNSDTEFALAAPPPVVAPLSTGFSSTRVTMPTANVRFGGTSMCLVDLDRDGYTAADSDGLAVLKLMLGFAPSTALSDFDHACSNRPGTVEAIAVFNQQVANRRLDIDGDGRVAPLTDGMLLLRYLLGLRGNALVTGLGPASGATRSTASAIETYLQSQCAIAP